MSTHTEHIDELIEGYVLGSLDAHERERCAQHAAVCPPCKQRMHAVEDTAHMLAFAVAAVPPPITCKRKLLEKVAREQFLSAPTRPRRAGLTRSTLASLAAVLLVLATGVWSLSLRRELAQVRSELELARSEAAIARAEAVTAQSQITQYAMLDEVLRDPEAVRSLQVVGEARAAGAKTYMKAGENEAMLMVWGLPTLPPGKVYQVWVARDSLQQPLDKFVQTTDTTYLRIAPPEPMDRYQEIMITVEDAPGATVPSKETVLAGEL